MKSSSASLALYDYWRSSAAYRVRIGLYLKSLTFDSLPIDLKPGSDEQLSDAYRNINPQGRVPAIRTGQRAITQSLAILEWLDETHPNPPFLPSDPLDRADVRSFAQLIASDIHPLNNLSVLGRLKTQFNADETGIGDWYRHWISEGFTALEQMLSERREATYAFGEQPTLADICLVPQMYNARRFDTDLTPFPRLVKIDQRAQQNEAFSLASPETFKAR